MEDRPGVVGLGRTRGGIRAGDIGVEPDGGGEIGPGQGRGIEVESRWEPEGVERIAGVRVRGHRAGLYSTRAGAGLTPRPEGTTMSGQPDAGEGPRGVVTA